MLFDEVLIEAPQAWAKDAACVERRDVEFFPARGKPTAPAKAVCASCLVRQECLGYALELNMQHGIWGGLSERERRRVRRQRGLTSAQARARTEHLTGHRARRGR